MEKTIYDDYKYVLQDTGSISIGARYSFEELMHSEDVPFKFKVIAERYLTKDLSLDTTLESQLYYMKKEGFVYECYRQLKTKIKVSVLKERKGLFGKKKKSYATEIIPIREFVEMDEEWKKEHGILIQELVISKLALMTFTA